MRRGAGLPAALPLAALLLLAATAARADVHPNTEGGVAINRAFAVGEIDNVNLFNGALALTIPLGLRYPVGGALSYGLTLVNNSNPWDFSTNSYYNPPVPIPVSQPSACSNAGLGWRVSLGAVSPAICLSTDDNNVSQGLYVYEGPDGAQHIFYPTLHPSDPEDPGDGGATQNVQYTRDGSYLRLTRLGGTTRIEFPDATLHFFDSNGHITQMSDRFGNRVFISYPDPSGCSGIRAGETSCWQITDSTGGRTNWVYFRSDLPPYTGAAPYGPLVSRIMLASYRGGQAEYDFAYTQATIGRGCPSYDPNYGDVSVPLLQSVTLPDGSSFAPGTSYITTPAGMGQCNTGSGSVTGLTLPTLGRIEWNYLSYDFPPASSGGNRRTRNWGVVSRTLKDAGGSVLGTWTYAHCLGPWSYPANCTSQVTSQQVVNTLTDPLGNMTARYFSVATTTAYGPGPNIYDYGRQYTPLVQMPGTLNFLAEQLYDPTGTVRRTVYLRHGHDQVSGFSLPDAANVNGREILRRTNFDDGSATVDYDTEFDGVGHFRFRTSAGGSFPGNNTRYTRHQWNPQRGTYDVDQASNSLNPGYSPLSSAEPWVSGVSYDYAQENGAAELHAYCYDPATGFVQRRRSYAQSTADPTFSQSFNDVVAVFTPDGSGNVATESYYGGDIQTVGTGDLCTLGLGGFEYQITHNYTSGVVNRSQSAYVSFPSVDRTIDPATGLVQSSRDTAGFQTSYVYDLLGRTTQVQPQQSAWTVYTYQTASGTLPPKLAVDQTQNGTTTFVLAETKYQFDSLGRLTQKDIMMADGTRSYQSYGYNALGWKTTVSEQGDSLHATRYLNYDPFGRPGRIQLADGHTIFLSYSGLQSVTRQVTVGTGWTGSAVSESPASTTENYDRFGRLASVAEPSDSSGSSLTTSYGYDPGSRLSSVSTTTATGTTQTRIFNYDLRGFLLWESHPETAANSLGLGHHKDYTGYDSHGHYHRMVEGGVDPVLGYNPRDLSFTYDPAERLGVVYRTNTSASCVNGSSTCIKQFLYDYPAPPGKLYQAIRYNHLLLGSAPHVMELITTYTYGGLDGRISQRTLQDNFDGNQGVTNEAFTQSFTWNQLGKLDSETYPDCAPGFTSCTGTQPRTVQYRYSNGFLTGVADDTGTLPGYPAGDGIAYAPSGMVRQVLHANQVLTTYTADASGMARPAAITTTKPDGTVVWSTGPYSYDGAGNVVQIGHGGYYFYDGVSRLFNSVVQINAVDNPAPAANTTMSQSISYDAFGNIQSMSSRSTPTDSATNRLSGAAYDASGNLTYWNFAVYEYNELNQLKHYTNGAQEWLYAYDADDERAFSFQVGVNPRFDRWTLRGLDGKVERQFEVVGYQWNNWGSGSDWKDYDYRDGVLLMRHTRTVGHRRIVVDHLGTPRLVHDIFGNPSEFHVYYPFGEEILPPGTTSQDGERMRFTGHERDLASLTSTYPNSPQADDLDYMHARHYNPLIGRFLSFDPVMQTGRAKSKPQLWNRYAYALDNPLAFVDPTGEDVSLGISFQGNLSEQQKAEILRLISKYFKSLDIGKVFVFDAAKFNETNTSLFGLLSDTGVASLTIDASASSSVAKPGLVPAGSILGDSSLSGSQQLQAIANVASHEILAHQFHATAFESMDALAFARNTIFRDDIEVRSRYGTVADHAALVDPQTRDSVINGPIPINAADLLKAQGILRPQHLTGPSPRQ